MIRFAILFSCVFAASLSAAEPKKPLEAPAIKPELIAKIRASRQPLTAQQKTNIRNNILGLKRQLSAIKRQNAASFGGQEGKDKALASTQSQIDSAEAWLSGGGNYQPLPKRYPRAGDFGTLEGKLIEVRYILDGNAFEAIVKYPVDPRTNDGTDYDYISAIVFAGPTASLTTGGKLDGLAMYWVGGIATQGSVKTLVFVRVPEELLR